VDLVGVAVVLPATPAAAFTYTGAGMTINDIVKLTQYLVRAADIPAYAAVRARMLAGARPASMLLVVPALVRPGFLLEVEVIAATAQ